MVRKKNNNLKRYIAQANAAVSGLAFGMLAGVDQNKVSAYKLKTGEPVRVQECVARAMADCCFKFAILLVVTSEESNGKERTITHYERMAAPYRHIDLIDHLNAIHCDMMEQEKARGNDLTGAGWMCCPLPKLPDDELEAALMRIFEQKKALV